MALAISTSWNAHRCRDAAQLLFEIKALGFEAVELSYNLSADLVEDLFFQSRKLGINITSLHNYCPAPKGLNPLKALPDCFSLASLDEQERELAVKYTKISIDTASRVGAGSVVLHCGRVQMLDTTRQLIQLYESGQKQSAEFAGLKEAMLRERQERVPAYLAQVFKSLQELNSHALAQKILLGIENRFYYSEIPTLSEIGLIFKELGAGQIYYWHDTGHAQVMENLGFARHKDYLENHSVRLLGTHLHDIRLCQDHLAPGFGDLDFTMLKPYLRKDTLKVIEAHYPAAAVELAKSRELILKTYDGCD